MAVCKNGEQGRVFGGLKIVRIIAVTFAGICLAAAMAWLFGWLVMLLWNWLMPQIFGLGKITFWQAFGLTVLGKIFFGGIHGNCSNKSDHIHRKVNSRWHSWLGVEDDKDSDSEDFGHLRRNIKEYREFWKAEGRDAFAAYLKRRGDEGTSGGAV